MRSGKATSDISTITLNCESVCFVDLFLLVTLLIKPFLKNFLFWTLHVLAWWVFLSILDLAGSPVASNCTRERLKFLDQNWDWLHNHMGKIFIAESWFFDQVSLLNYKKNPIWEKIPPLAKVLSLSLWHYSHQHLLLISCLGWTTAEQEAVWIFHWWKYQHAIKEWWV